MKWIAHFLRGALLGGMALLVVGSLLVANDSTPTRGGTGAKTQDISTDDGSSGTAATSNVKPVLFTMSLAGAAVAVGTLLLLLLFRVGPFTKIVCGVVGGPFITVLFWGTKELQRGHDDNVGGLVALGMIVGLLAGFLEADRVRKVARQEGQGDSL